MSQKIQKMQKLSLNQKEFPTLSTWDSNFLDEILESLSKEANPNKMEITQEDKLWAATMLEMDLKSQNGAILETEEANPLTEHNLKMLGKMKTENIHWTESYPGELYPIEAKEE